MNQSKNRIMYTNISISPLCNKYYMYIMEWEYRKRNGWKQPFRLKFIMFVPRPIGDRITRNSFSFFSATAQTLFHSSFYFIWIFNQHIKKKITIGLIYSDETKIHTHTNNWLNDKTNRIIWRCFTILNCCTICLFLFLNTKCSSTMATHRRYKWINNIKIHLIEREKKTVDFVCLFVGWLVDWLLG